MKQFQRKRQTPTELYKAYAKRRSSAIRPTASNRRRRMEETEPVTPSHTVPPPVRDETEPPVLVTSPGPEHVVQDETESDDDEHLVTPTSPAHVAHVSPSSAAHVSPPSPAHVSPASPPHVSPASAAPSSSGPSHRPPIDPSTSGPVGEDLPDDVDDHVDFGAPPIPDLLPSYHNHRATRIWMLEVETKTMKVHRRNLSLSWLCSWRRDTTDPDSWFGLARRSRLTDLEDFNFSGVDHALIQAFVERWHPHTSSFHLPWGEMTITLHDVCVIMGLPIDGEILCTSGTVQSRREWLQTTFGFDGDEMLRHKSSIFVDLVKTATEKMLHSPRPPAASLASAYILLLIGSALFVDKTTNRMSYWLIDLVRDHQQTGTYAWGHGTLAYLYRSLGIASRKSVAGMAGCTALLQFWIYAHFPSFRPAGSEDVHRHDHRRWADRLAVLRTPMCTVQRVQSFRLQLDQMRAEDVHFMPYGDVHLDFTGEYAISRYRGILRIADIEEPYMPDRCLRQFGYIQTIPLSPLHPTTESLPSHGRGYKRHFYPPDDTWASRHLESSRVSFEGLTRASSPWLVSDDYMTWFAAHGHPYMLPTSMAQQVPVDRPPPVPVSDTRRLHILVERLRYILDSYDIPSEISSVIAEAMDEAVGTEPPIARSQVRVSQQQH